jgi:hypothetical protein
MTADQWDEITVVMLAYWPNKDIPSESFDVWFNDLSEFESEHVEAAIIALGRDGREWMPNGGQIRNKLIELRQPVIGHERAYELAMYAAGPGGGFNAGLEWLRAESALAAEAVETYGWREFCLNGQIDEGTRRAQYREVFKNIAARSNQQQRYAGIEAKGLKGLPGKGPRKFGELIATLPKGAA